MADRYYIGSGGWNDTNRWSTTSGGSGGASVPTAVDLAHFDSSSSNCTLAADCGTITDDGSGAYTITAGCLGMILDASYTGTLDANAFDVAIGTSGFDALAASGATVDQGEGVWASQGSLLLHTSMTWYERTATTVLAGGSSQVRNTLDALYRGGGPGGGACQLRDVVIAAGAYWETVNSTTPVRGGCDCHGDILFGGEFTVSGATSTFHASAVVAGSGGVNVNTQDCHIETPDNFACSLSMYPGGTLTAGSGTIAGKVGLSNYASGTATLDASVSLTDLEFTAVGGTAPTVACNDNAVFGDISQTGSSGAFAATGNLVLSGTADQSVDIDALTAAPTFAVDKSAGDVEIVSGDVTISADSTVPGACTLGTGVTLSIDSGRTVTLTGGSLSVAAGGSITGEGTFKIDTPGAAATCAIDASATVDVGTLYYVHNPAQTDLWITSPIHGGLSIANESPTAATVILPSGSFQFAGALEYLAIGGDLTIDLATHAPTWLLEGDFTITESGGTVGILPGNVVTHVQGTGNQTINAACSMLSYDNLGAVVIDKTTGTVTLADELLCTSMQAVSGTLDLAGHDITTTTGDLIVEAGVGLLNVANNSLHVAGLLRIDGTATTPITLDTVTVTVQGASADVSYGTFTAVDASAGTHIEASDNGTNRGDCLNVNFAQQPYVYAASEAFGLIGNARNTVFAHRTKTLLARMEGRDGTPISRATIESIAYTVYQLDSLNPTREGTPIAGHSSVSLTVADTVFDTPQVDAMWSDPAGYNFRFTPDVTDDDAFPEGGAAYRVKVLFTPTSDRQSFEARFELRAV